MKRRRRTLGDAKPAHRARAREHFELSIRASMQATGSASKQRCVAATSALVRAAYYYGIGTANEESSRRTVSRARSRAKNYLDDATSAAMNCSEDR